MSKKKWLAFSIYCLFVAVLGAVVLGAMYTTADFAGDSWTWSFWEVAGFVIGGLSLIIGVFACIFSVKRYTEECCEEFAGTTKASNRIWVLKENWATPGEGYSSTIKLLAAKSDREAIAELDALLANRPKRENFIIKHSRTMYCEYENDNYDLNHYEAVIKSYVPNDFVDILGISNSDYCDENEEEDPE